MLYGNYREIQIPKSVNKLLFCQKLKKVGKFSLFCLLFKYSKMLQNLRKCLSQFFHRFYLCSCPFPELKGFQWLKTQMRLFFRVGGSLNYFFRLCELFFQALHKIALRENICTLRVCDVILQLMSTLIDLGLLAKKNLSTNNPSTSKENGQTENK